MSCWAVVVGPWAAPTLRHRGLGPSRLVQAGRPALTPTVSLRLGAARSDPLSTARATAEGPETSPRSRRGYPERHYISAGQRCGPGGIRTPVGFSRQIYSLLPLSARAPTLEDCEALEGYKASVLGMPTFDVVSEVDMQEVRNAVDQAERDLTTRFDFKGTGSTIELAGHEVTLRSSTEDRLKAVVQVLEEKLVRRKISLRALDFGKVEEAARSTVRQLVTIKAGINSDQARAINKFIKDKAPKGVSSSTQGDQVRVSSKKRDELQATISALKEQDFGVPLQFENFRD